MTTTAQPLTRPRGESAPPGGRRSLRRTTEARWGLLMIAPLGLGLAVFYLWPMLQTFYFGFTAWGPFGDSTWTGLDNYLRLLADEKVWAALRNSLAYTGLVLLGVPLALVFAVLLDQRKLRGRGLFRTLYFLPVVTMPSAVALLWQYLYNGDFGLVNQALATVGVAGPSWASDPGTAMFALAAVGVWMGFGYNLVILMAGLQTVPRQLYEAAAIDGAGTVRQFVSVTVPMISPTVFFVSVITIINGLQMFDLVYLMMPPGSPALPATQTVVHLFYQKSFVQNDPGYGAAIAVLLFAVIGLLTVLQFRLQRRWVHRG
ncbi:sugar ABC transporter permease [Nonomuraea sp. NPDC049152]|uniref:carbohydrate ABC transporter permease n=1 Tax=Nonomuraea sp. NPDC049152 TaxID=3154350 RepID=UPI0033C3F85A